MVPHRRSIHVADPEDAPDVLDDLSGDDRYEGFVADLLRPQPIEDAEYAAYLRREELLANGFSPEDEEDEQEDDDEDAEWEEE